jgi:nitrite reductase/ring-hydroxylating ferredoxin subunit
MIMEKIIDILEFDKKGKSLVFREGSKQILVLGIDDKVFALDNRCPHEGYPLSQGKTEGKSCVLTCNWHNWKFDLESGKCLVGGDNVRTYPTSIKDKKIHIDLSDPSPEEVRDTIIEGFKVAFEERQYGQISREITRLSYNKLDPLYALKKSIIWSYDKFEYGMTHAYAATADWLSFYKELENEEDKIISLTEAIDHIALDSLRHREYPFKETGEKFNIDDLYEYILKEDVGKAEGITLSGLSDGLLFKDFEEVLSRAALEHYNDFGHSLIYVTKVSEISEELGDKEVDRALVLSLVRSLCYSTKEDLLPEFKKYAETVKQLDINNFGQDEVSGNIGDKLNVNAVYKWLLEESQHTNIESLYKEILLSNAKNFLRFNLKYQEATHNPVTKNVGWLDFTHAITFSNAVRRTCTKYPDLWSRGLVQMASFSGRNSSNVDDIELEDWKILKNEFIKKSYNHILDHGLGLPIFSAHILKTTVASLEEVHHFGESEVSDYLLAAMNRFISSPLKQKHIRRITHQGINLVSKDFK